MKSSLNHARNSIFVGASLYALAAANPSFAQACPGTLAAPCDVAVTTDGQTIVAQGPTQIVNTASNTVIRQNGTSYLLVDNRAGASIASLTLSPPTPNPVQPGAVLRPHVNSAIVNAGAINGNVAFISGGIYVNAGGTVSGNVGPANLQGFSNEIFINRGGPNLGVAGTIDPGNGADTFIQSFNASNIFAIPSTLPLHFEVGGVEALGAGTMVTVTNEAGSTTANGLAVWGDGAIVNQATINDISLDGSNLPPATLANTRTRAVNYAGSVGQSGQLVITQPGANGQPFQNIFTTGSALQSFTNQGIVNGDLAINAAAFVNSGAINIRSSQPGTIIQGAAGKAFSFVNSGSVIMTDAGTRQPGNILDSAITLVTAVEATAAAPVSILNDSSGIISGGLAFAGRPSDFRFENKGAISIGANPNGIDRAAELSWDGIDAGLPEDDSFAATSVTLLNSGTLEGGIDASGATRSFSFTNSGTITTDPNDPDAEAVQLEANDFAAVGGDDDIIDGDNFTFLNTGSIAGTTSLFAEATTVTVTNSGQMARAVTPNQKAYPARYSGLDIEQETNLDGILNFTNSGTIETADHGGGAVLISVEAGDIGSGLPAAATANAMVTIVNSGTIRTTGSNFLTPGQFYGLPQNRLVSQPTIALGVALDAEGQSSLSITNAAGGQILSQANSLLFGAPNGAITLPNQATGNGIVATADTITIVNDGLIRTTPGGGTFLSAVNTPTSTLAFSYADGNIMDDATMEGVIGGGIDTFNSVDLVTNGATGVIEGGIALRQGDDTLTNMGRINGNIFAGSGNDRIFNTGSMTGNVAMGAGNDVFVTLLKDYATHLSGTADGGEGLGDSFIFNVSQGGSLQDMALAQKSGFEYVALAGDGEVTSSGDVALAPIQLATGAITLAQGSTVTAASGFAFRGDAALDQDFTNRGTINGSVALGTGNDRFANYGALNGNLDLGDGDDSFVQGINATLNGTADGGAGTDSFVIDITGGGKLDQSLYTQLVNFESLGLTGSGAIESDAPLPVQTVQLDSGAPITFGQNAVIQTQGDTAVTGSDSGDDLTNQGTIIGDVALGGGDDAFANAGTTTGNVDTGDGADQVGNSGTVTGDVDTGSGDDSLTNSGSISGDVNLDGGSTPPPPVEETSQLAQARFASAFAVTALALPTDGNDEFANSGTVSGSVFAGGGNDRFTLTGSVGGDVDLGSGDDELILQGAWAIGGTTAGGDGTDVARASFTGTGAAPQEVNLSGFSAFEQLQVESGTGAINGTASFGSIAVDGGRLIGRTGSTINGNVTVASAGTFGSAGTVNGSVNVSGTLSPGASPGTMTVNGNVLLNAGSNSLFEFTPAASDALVINGSLTIANGASLTLTGNRPLTPGIYNLVTATGGVNGTFGTNVTRDATVLGVLSYAPNAIQLLSMFQLRAGANAQATLTNAYLNRLLLGGAPSGILAAFPVLVGADGFASAAALSTLSPEPYASVVQVGIENGLAITQALRSVRLAGISDESGLFVFGQAYGNRRDLSGDARGVAKADIDSSGFLGGVGYGNSTLGATLFVGRSDSRQRLRGIGARNDADGLFFGGRLHYAAGGFSAGATLLFDRANADTLRNPATGGTARSHYSLRGTSIDAFVGYGFPVGDGWQIGPEVGVTHISVKRGAAVESGGGAFALTVAKQKYDATFLTADLKLSAPGAGAVRPWIAGGVRHRASGDAITATGAFAGASVGYTVAGAERDRTLAHAGAGLDIAVSSSVSLFLEGDAEFSGQSASRHINGGITLRF
ncbi:autotransporter domain-containing protein [Sphingobium sp. AN558]|uniref:autotransporter domain-containing protein n=1 Tax=Sphingobium sp. AN558 TaxID=3133442 RepID=UPI0030BC519C